MAGVGRGQEIFRNGDASDAYANRKALYLSFFHLASKLEINFKAFVTSYGENFSSDYNFENVFGRNDPIATFKQTTRRINISWSIPAASLEEAKTNLARCNRLAQFMYPAYTSTGANTLSKPPLMKVRFANLIRNAARGMDPGARTSGLLSAVNNLSINPVFDDSSGFFDPGVGTLFPKVIDVSCDITVLHEHNMGWGVNRGFNKTELADYPFGGVGAPFGDLETASPSTTAPPEAGILEGSPGESIPEVDSTIDSDERNARANELEQRSALSRQEADRGGYRAPQDDYDLSGFTGGSDWRE
jgi:hypothetical protein